MNRLPDIAVVVVWLTSMVALVAHDLWPRWSADDPPKADPVARDVQVGLFNGDGQRIGTGWTSVRPELGLEGDPNGFGDLIIVDSTTVIDTQWMRQPLRFRVESTLNYQHDQLDQLSVTVHGAPVRIRLRGENMQAGFPCELTVGPIRRTFAFDADQMKALGDAMRPFDILPDLEVGKSWQVKIFNPLDQVLGRSQGLKTLIVRVTGTQSVQHRGQPVECFRVEAPEITALVAPDGHVLEQHVVLPMFGPITIRDEVYDDAARSAAKQDYR